MTASKYSNDRLIQKKFIQKENNTRSGSTQLEQTSARTSCVLGAEAIYNLLSNLDFPSLDRELRIQLFFINEDLNDLETELKNLENQGYILFDKEQQQLKKFLFRQLQLLIYRRAKKLRRLKLVRHFRRTKARAEWMVLSIIPVLPPDLRPIIQLDGDQVAVSDLNKLYQKVLFRNNRIKKQSSSKSDESKYAQRLLQEAVDALIENGKAGSDPICAANERPLKSLSDMLKGKKGRFRQNLLGKRVDYSGRSVIVVGPNLKLHECGLPKELAIELFQPFLIRRLMCNKIVRTIVGAKRIIQKKDPIIWRILEQVLQNHPVLLNRAPTLHRVGIQAFQPKLVEGRAILLHPLVCSAFNADFDGDQMAVHVPLCFEARAEAWMLMWSRNNLLSTATGQPLVIPSQDMVLGCYYLTTDNFKKQKGTGNHFQTMGEVLKNYNQDRLKVHSPIWIKWDGKLETNIDTENPIEIQLRKFGNYTKIYFQYRQDFDEYGTKKIQYIRTTPGRTLLNSIIQEKSIILGCSSFSSKINDEQ
jgi:DNA-directed RNA polymerase subunit beta'